MALTEKMIIDRIEILETGVVQIRTATVIERDGIEISRVFHRKCFCPGDNVSSEDERVQAVAAATWTQDCLDAWASLKTK